VTFVVAFFLGERVAFFVAFFLAAISIGSYQRAPRRSTSGGPGCSMSGLPLCGGVKRPPQKQLIEQVGAVPMLPSLGRRSLVLFKLEPFLCDSVKMSFDFYARLKNRIGCWKSMQRLVRVYRVSSRDCDNCCTGMRGSPNPSTTSTLKPTTWNFITSS
jgi:hypothetical protein